MWNETGMLLVALFASGCANTMTSPAGTQPVPENHAPAIVPLDPLPLGIRALEDVLAKSGSLDHETATRARTRLAALYAATADRLENEPRSKRHQAAAALFQQLSSESTVASDKLDFALHLAGEMSKLGAQEGRMSLLRYLVCPSRYPEGNPDKSAPPSTLPQDHDAKYWQAWEDAHVEPVDLVRNRKTKGDKHPFVARPGGPTSLDEETSYRSPYVDCEASLLPGTARVWLMLGDAHRTRDAAAGVYALHRAATAYEMARNVQPRDGLAADLATLRLGLVYEAEERHQLAVETLVQWLSSHERPGDLAAPALVAVGRALTYVDFVGPPASDPVIPRADVLDTEPNPNIAEHRMRIGIERVQNDAIIPQHAWFTSAVYAELARAYGEITQAENRRDALVLLFDRDATDPNAPMIASELIENSKTAIAMRRARSRERAEGLLGQADAWARAATLGAHSAWEARNKGNSQAIAARDALFAKLPRAESRARIEAAGELLEFAYSSADKAEVITSALTRAILEADKGARDADEVGATDAFLISFCTHAALGDPLTPAEWNAASSRVATIQTETARARGEAMLSRAKSGSLGGRGKRKRSDH